MRVPYLGRAKVLSSFCFATGARGGMMGLFSQ